MQFVSPVFGMDALSPKIKKPAAHLASEKNERRAALFEFVFFEYSLAIWVNPLMNNSIVHTCIIAYLLGKVKCFFGIFLKFFGLIKI